jgi:hypothetical protein
MRLTILVRFLLASCAVMTVPTISTAAIPMKQAPAVVIKDREAWQGTRWGMSKSEIRDVFPQAVDWRQNYGTSQTLPRFGMKTYPVKGTCQEEVSFSFKDGGLNLVHITVSDNSMTPEAELRCSGIVERALTGKYGRVANSAPEHEQATTDKLLTWFTPSSQISFSRDQSTLGQNLDGAPIYFYYTTVDYRPRLMRLEDTY